MPLAQIANNVSELPTASVVVLNLNGRDMLADCFDSLAAQDYAIERMEVILVDNGSTDGSAAFVREAYPWVRLHEAGRNLGFTGGNNLGARLATGEYLAILNNDTRVDRGWLRAMVEALEDDPDVACVGAKMLDEQGQVLDFVGTGLNLYGRAFQIDKGLPAEPGFHDEPRETLAACGGALLIRRDVFLDVGGFDDDFIIYYEDVDLGWRLWLMGYRVLFVPEAVVYHKQHRTGGRFPVEQLYALSETNALRLLIKNCEEETLWQVLPFSLLMAVKRSVEQAGLDRERYRYGQLVPGEQQAGVWQPEERMSRVATSFLVAIDQIAEDLPRLMAKRQAIQARRARSDEEIFARFPLATDNPIFPWRRYQVVQDNLVAELDLPEAVQPRHGSRLLIITHETIGPRMAGPGIRAWEMACALAERFEVILAAPGSPGTDAPVRHHPGVRLVSYETDQPGHPSLDPYLINADVVLAMGPLFAKIPRLQDLGKPTIVDLYDPFELEKLAQSPVIEAQHHPNMDVESVRHLRLEALVGDFYICASERQRDFWLGTLLAAGRANTATYAQDPTLRSLIDVVPFGLPAEPPRRDRAVLKGVHPGIGAEDKLLLWNGGLWQWFDPLTLVDALAQVVVRRDDVKLFFAAGKHFDSGTVPEMPIYAQTVARCRELGLLDRHVFFGEWVPYDERGSYLLEADLGVSTHQPTVESRFASRTRLLDCVWAGLPVLSTAGDPLSDLVAGRGLGRTVPPARPDLLAETILEMLADEDLGQRVAAQAEAVRDELSWARCVEPIAAFMERVAFAPDALEASREAAKARQVEAHIHHLKGQITDQQREKQEILEAWEEERERMRRAWEEERQEWEDAQQNAQTYIRKLETHLEEINQGKVMRLLNTLSGKKGS